MTKIDLVTLANVTGGAASTTWNRPGQWNGQSQWNSNSTKPANQSSWTGGSWNNTWAK